MCLCLYSCVYLFFRGRYVYLCRVLCPWLHVPLPVFNLDLYLISYEHFLQAFSLHMAALYCFVYTYQYIYIYIYIY